MRPSRPFSWGTAAQALALGALLLGSVCLRSVAALEAREEPLAIAEEQAVPDKDVVGESVGEPAAEDAPVEGEPGPGETVRVPPDDSGEAGGDVLPPGEDDAAKQDPAN